jgi:hypothetical protein
MVDIDGLRGSPAAAPSGPPRGPRRRFLAVWFRCCHVYGRMYRNRDETAYEGRCPRCGAMVDALIGPHGTSRRVFEAI